MTTDIAPLTRPSVNLNGTSVQGLLDQQAQIVDACEALQKALSNASPHGRDYPDSLLRLAEDAAAVSSVFQQVQVIADRADAAIARVITLGGR